MPVSTGNFPKALTGNKKKLASGLTMSKVMKADKAADAKMTPAQMKKDIASDKKLLAQKLKKGK